MCLLFNSCEIFSFFFVNLYLNRSISARIQVEKASALSHTETTNEQNEPSILGDTSYMNPAAAYRKW